MTRVVQERVVHQQNRLAELCALRRPLSDEEIAEVILLKKRERRRRENRKWRTCDENRKHGLALSRKWRQARAAERRGEWIQVQRNG